MSTQLTSPNPKQPKKNKKRRRLRNFMRFVFILTIFVGLALSGILAGTVIGFIQSSDVIGPEELALKGFTTKIYDHQGNLIQPLMGDKNREMVDIYTVPKYLKDAFVAIEDKRFYEHAGIDIRRTLSAFIGFVKSSDTTHGGSTITQQVVRNLTNDFERSIRRKIQEQWRAVELERHLTKDQILEVYMNIIFMGNNCYGVQSASKLYFDKDVADLTLAEATIIAGITNAPSEYNPFAPNGPQKIKNRQETILAEMRTLSMISEEEYQNALSEPLTYAERSNNKNLNTTVQSYFIDQVISDVKLALMEKGYSSELAGKMIYNNGLSIYTTMDPKVQKALDTVFSNPEQFPILQPNQQAPKAAMIILDATTGHIKGMYGGAGPKKISMGFNYAVDMKRQPGSTFKPLAVYAPAIDTKRITAGTVFDDVPIYLDPKNEKPYPTNYNAKDYRGLIAAREALKYSLNTVTAKIWTMDAGFSKTALEYLTKVNIDRRNENYVSTALGGLEEGVSPLEMAAAYVPFANKGVYYRPTTFLKVLDAKGNVLVEYIPEPSYVYEDTTAYIVTDMLKDAVKYGGTGYPYGLLQGGKMPTSGKTGTTSDNYDKWFVGYSPYYVGATWYGYETNVSLLPAEYSKALTLWNAVMEKVHEPLEPKPFEVPIGIVRKLIDKYANKVPGKYTKMDPRGDALWEEIYAKGTEPKDTAPSTLQVLAKVTATKKDDLGRPFLWTPLCDDEMVEKVFLQKPVPYKPTKEDEPRPADFKYEIPTTECEPEELVEDPLDEDSFDEADDKTSTKKPSTKNSSTKPSSSESSTKPSSSNSSTKPSNSNSSTKPSNSNSSTKPSSSNSSTKPTDSTTKPNLNEDQPIGNENEKTTTSTTEKKSKPETAENAESTNTNER